MGAHTHTRSPWTYTEAPRNLPNAAFTVYGGADLSLPVADVLKTAAGAINNARLIHAAPDMLTALQMVVREFEGFEMCGSERRAFEAAISAVRKATGAAS